MQINRQKVSKLNRLQAHTYSNYVTNYLIQYQLKINL